MKNYFKAFIALVVLAFGSCSEETVTDPVLAPTAVENFVATPGDSEVVLTWDINTNQKITEYEIAYTDIVNPVFRPADHDTYTVTGLENGKEYSITIYAKNGDQSSPGTSATATPFGINTDGPEMSSFNFLKSNNPDMALEEVDKVDLTGKFDQTINTVTFNADDISAYIYIDSLAPTFEVPSGAVVSVNGVEQVSGVSRINFTNTVQYEVSLDGVTRIYSINVAKSQYATIPDAEFLARLKDMGMPFNENDQLDITHSLVTDYESSGKINLDGDGYTTLIESLKGIEFFISVKEIDCERNNISSLDLRRNAGMKNLVAGLQPLTTLNFGDRTDIEILYLNSCNLTEATIQPIVEANLALKRLYIQGTPTITIADVTNSTSLERLKLSESTAMASASYITAMLGNNSNSVDLRVYSEDGTTQCDSYDPATFQCQWV